MLKSQSLAACPLRPVGEALSASLGGECQSLKRAVKMSRCQSYLNADVSIAMTPRSSVGPSLPLPSVYLIFCSRCAVNCLCFHGMSHRLYPFRFRTLLPPLIEAQKSLVRIPFLYSSFRFMTRCWDREIALNRMNCPILLHDMSLHCRH